MTQDLTAIPLTSITGEPASLTSYAGHVLMIVNVASKCGLTTQYEALERLFQAYHNRGFFVLGFPSNDFADQEPGSDAEIAAFCKSTYDVTFPMFAKISVSGANRHPLYTALIEAWPEARHLPDSGFRERLVSRGRTPADPPEVMWNFEKFIVGPSGAVTARFGSDVTPDDPMVVDEIEKQLKILWG